MDRFEQIAQRSVLAQESTIEIVKAISEQTKQMNDNFILHNKVACDTATEIKALRQEMREEIFKWVGWAIKVGLYVFVVAILVLIGVNQIPKLISVF